jgi:hypothetical protein
LERGNLSALSSLSLVSAILLTALHFFCLLF